MFSLKRLYTVTLAARNLRHIAQLLKFNQSLKIEEAYVLRRLPVSFHFNSFCPVKDCTRWPGRQKYTSQRDWHRQNLGFWLSKAIDNVYTTPKATTSPDYCFVRPSVDMSIRIYVRRYVRIYEMNFESASCSTCFFMRIFNKLLKLLLQGGKYCFIPLFA